MAWRKFIIVIVILALVIPVRMVSQVTKDQLMRLDHLDLDTGAASQAQKVISASRTEKMVRDLPVTVHVISREEIIDNGYTTLVDVLKSVPGIRVSQPGSALEGETFLMRGLYGNYYCKILVDNVPIQPSVASGMPVAAQLPIRLAERIEVIFGPASAVYGADALAGVINIITHESERPVSANADIAIGSDLYRYLNVSIGGKIGKSGNVMYYNLFGNFSARADQNIKYDIPGVYDPFLYDTSYNYLDSPYYHGDSTRPVLGRMPEGSSLIGFSMKWRGLRFNYHLMERRTQSSVGLQTAAYSYDSPRSSVGELIQRFNLSYEYSGKKFSSLTNLSYLWYRFNDQSAFAVLDPANPTGEAFKFAASDDLFLEEKFTWVPASSLEITAGASCQVSGNLPATRDLFSPFDVDAYRPFSTDPISDTSLLGDFGFNPFRFNNVGVFAQVFYSAGRFTFLGGYRFDHNSDYGPSNSPRLALLYRPAQALSLRISAGTGFRAPSGYFSYASLAGRVGDSILYQLVPNTALQPERLTAAEAGARWDRGNRLTLDVSFFYHFLDRQFSRSIVLLDPVAYPLATNLLAEAYVNDDNSRAVLYGVQVDAVFRDIIEVISLGAEAHLTLSKGKERLPNDFGDIERYRMMPAYLGQVNISLRPVKKIYLFLRNNFAGDSYRRYIPLPADVLDQLGYDVNQKGYYTIDFLARFDISRNFEAFFHLNNIFDRHYGGIDAYGTIDDLRYNPQYGRNFRLGLTFRMD